MWEPKRLCGWYIVFISSCMRSSLSENGAWLRSELGSSRDSAAIEMLHAAKVVGRSSEAEGPVIGGRSVDMSENSSEPSHNTLTTWCCQCQWLDKLVELRARLCMICKATGRLLSSASRAKSGFVADAHDLLDSKGLSPGLSKFIFTCHFRLQSWQDTYLTVSSSTGYLKRPSHLPTHPHTPLTSSPVLSMMIPSTMLGKENRSHSLELNHM